MKRVLIFTASTGGGHNQAAKSLENEFKSYGYEVIKLDVLKETSKLLDTLISDGYRILATSLPKMYGGLYKLSDKKRVNRRVTRLITKLHYNKIYQLIIENKPDLIIGTHPFIVNVIGYMKANELIKIPFISIVTDYQAHQTYVNSYVDAYITASYYTSQSLINRGISEQKIYPYGIPIRREFLEKENINSIKSHNLHSRLTILLMGGSMGVKAMKKVLNNLVVNENAIKIIVVCGNNNILKYEIEKNYMDNFKNKEIIVYGFTKEIPQLMDISDIIITKPGGLTVSEAIVKNVPMIIPYFIPGQEEENADFLAKYNVAIRVNYIKDINYIIDYIVQNPEVLDKMKEKMKEISNTYSIENIVKLSDKLINQYSFKWGMVYES
ncbi:MGDG synthase family glycosyltransferase [Brassicibacter mesophilus]|uniref:MGDG synthase family glycosyltransferase n=1 Tax=Brassicibacter mesophilus TaxID=745119 RepID=UPI003D1CFF1A